MLHGAYPADLLEDTQSITDWSFVHDDDTDIIHQKIDVLGVNYYSTTLVRMWDGTGERASVDGHMPVGVSPWPGADGVEFLPQAGPFTSMGWNIAPSGLEELLLTVHAEFPDQPLMEDVELSKRLLAISRPACIARCVTTSGRRWETRGIWRTIMLMWRLRWDYWRGVPVQQLAEAYR